MARKIHSILVIGAGPAGVIPAIILARAGLSVTVVERQRFPRDKVCGECLSATGLATLGRAGLLEVLEPLGPARLTRTTLVAPGGATATHELAHGMWGLTRRRMDTALLATAEDAGVRVLQPARVENLQNTPAGVSAAVRYESNVVENVTADLALLADGKSALLPGADKPSPTRDLGIKAHFRNVSADASSIHLFSLGGHYGGLAAVEDGLWNVALSVPQAVVRRFQGDLAGLWTSLVAGNPFLQGAFAEAARETDWLASPLPRFPVRPDWPDHIIPVGNAAAALEPIGGEGMGLAMRSGELAASAILAANAVGTSVETKQLQAAFRALWRTRRPACRTVAVVVSQPALARAIIPFSSYAESATRVVLRLMGKASRS